jgi:hypothetical protein
MLGDLVLTEVMGSFIEAQEWAKKYQHLFPENELFQALLDEEERQPEVVVFAKLDAYAKMLDAKARRIAETE